MVPLIANLLRIGLGALFVFAGGSKAWDAQSFAYAVQNYQLTSWQASVVIAFYLPWLEVAIGLGLWSKRLYEGALLGAIALNLLFLGAITAAWWRKLDISCGCFGSETNHTSYGLHLFANSLMVAAGAGLMIYKRSPRAWGQANR